MSTLPRNTVTGAPQNFRQRVSRKAACGPRLPRVLGATARASALRHKGGPAGAETGVRGPPEPSSPTAQPPRGLTGCPGCTAGSSPCPDCPAPAGPPGLSAEGPPPWERRRPSGMWKGPPGHPGSRESAGCTEKGDRQGHEGGRGGQAAVSASKAQGPPASPCPDGPEGDEVGVDEGRTEEGGQQPQDRGARGHVAPPDPGEEGLG